MSKGATKEIGISIPEGYSSEGDVYNTLFKESVKTGKETGVQLYLDEETSNVNFHFPVYNSRVKDIPNLELNGPGHIMMNTDEEIKNITNKSISYYTL